MPPVMQAADPAIESLVCHTIEIYYGFVICFFLGLDDRQREDHEISSQPGEAELFGSSPAPATPCSSQLEAPEDLEVEPTQRDMEASPPDPPLSVPKATPPAVPQQQSLMLPPAQLSAGAIDRRVRRVMEPNARGQHKVGHEIRKLWEDGKKEKVFKLFAECGNDTETFVKKYSVKKEHEKELEVGVYFTFQTEAELADKPEKLWINSWMWGCKHSYFLFKWTTCNWMTCFFCINWSVHLLRKERTNIIARAKANPKKMMRYGGIWM